MQQSPVYPPTGQPASQPPPGYPPQNYPPVQPAVYPPEASVSAAPPMAPTPPPRIKRYDKLPLPVRMMEWLKSHWWAPVIAVLVLLVGVNILYQILYPYDVLPAGTRVDGVVLGGVKKDAAIARLNDAYSNIRTELYFGDATVPYRTIKAKDLGIQVDNSARLREVSYPVVLRLVPTSIWWAHAVNKINDPVYTYSRPTLDTFALKNLGENCYINPQNASLKLDDTQLKVVPMIPGGKCNMTDFKTKASSATEKNGTISIRTPLQSIDAPLTNEVAQQLADKLNAALKDDMPLAGAGQGTNVPSTTVKGWLKFTAVVPEQPAGGAAAKPAHLDYGIDEGRVRKYFDGTLASKVEKKPGISTVSTTDFRETARQNGEPGVMIDMKQTIASIMQVAGGQAKAATVTTGPVPPTTRYTRTYTPSADGFNALIQQFPVDNPGTFAISLQELAGKKPWLGGQVNAEAAMPAAGIEGVYAAYAAQVGIEDGSIQHSDVITSGKTVDDCISAALKDQEADCISALIGKVGNQTVQSRLRAIGLMGTDFTAETTTTTARDMAVFLQKYDASQLNVKQTGVLETPLRNIRERQGILQAAQSTRITVAGDRAGSYNEGGIVTTKGKYVLVVLSKDSDATTVAKLVRMIDELRTRKDALKS
jgi:hypothetical protein